MTSPRLSQTWFIGKECLGTSPIGMEYFGPTLATPRSYAFCCPVCGEVWARRIVTPSTPWFFWSICCSSCENHNPNMLAFPGSVYLPLDDSYLASLPSPVLKREVFIRALKGPIPYEHYNRRSR